MSHPFTPSEPEGAPTAARQDNSSDATQVVKPPTGGYDDSQPSATRPEVDAERLYSGPADPGRGAPEGPGRERAAQFSKPRSNVADPPVGAPTEGPSIEGHGDESRYSGRRDQSPAPGPTSTYPPSTPGYAPAGYPPAYVRQDAPQSQPSAALPTKPASRVGPAFLSALIGLLLTAAGVFLAAKFGVAAGRDIGNGTVGIKDSALTTLGALLILAAVVLNGWSPWSTVIPGFALTLIGGWALFDAGALARISSWTRSVLSADESAYWSISGFALVLGLVLLGSSAAAMMARASGKTDGAIIVRNQADPALTGRSGQPERNF